MFRWLWEVIFPKKTTVVHSEPIIIPEPVIIAEPEIKVIPEEPKPVINPTPVILPKPEPIPVNAISPVCLEALTIAKTQLGVKELPGNRGPKIKEYLNSVGLTEGYSWCMAFVYWCFQHAARSLSVSNPCTRTAGVINHWNVTKGIKVKMPRTGDIFVLDHGKGLGHTGFVKTVSEDKKSYTTIEGNSNTTGSREGTEVCSNTRLISAAAGFIRY